jgi:hypothetical protein
MPRSNRRNATFASLQPWHWFVLTAAVPIIHCANRLNLDLWHDEIYTIDVFVRRGPAFIVSDYHLPNNHVLFSLIEWPFACLSHSTFILRLPSFLCSLGTLVVVFRLGLRLSGLSCAVLSTALLGLNQMFLIFTIQVRGYSLSMFLAGCLAWFASSSTTDASWRRFTAIVFIGAAFLYVLPTNALFFLPIAAIAIGMAIVKQPRRQTVVEAMAWAAAGALALLCYLPILEQIRKVSASSSASSWSHLPVVAASFFRPATHDFVWFAPAVLLGLIAWACSRPADGQRNWTVPLVCGGVTAGAFFLTGLLRISPFERVYCPLLVFLALAGGWLLAELTEAVHRRFARLVSAQAATAAALAVVSLVVWPQLWDYPRRLEQRRNEFNAVHQWPEGDGWPIVDGYYCYYAANYRPSDIVNYLIDEQVEQVNYRVCWTDADHLNVWYYFAESGLPSTRRPSSDDRVMTYAILPEPPPWERLAKDCQLTDEELKAFRLVGDFGYYRLYRQAQEISSEAERNR